MWDREQTLCVAVDVGTCSRSLGRKRVGRECLGKGAGEWDRARTPSADVWDGAWTLCAYVVAGANSGSAHGWKANRAQPLQS
jgi:hypothetical protein